MNTRSINKFKRHILHLLMDEFPQVTFKEEEVFHWSAATKTIYYPKNRDPQFVPLLLHELGHYLLDHYDYSHDIELLRLEADAWRIAKEELAPKYKVVISEALIQSCLDTYREWQYQKSTCPKCHTVAIENQKNRFTCLNCSGSFRTNEARNCELQKIMI